MEATLPSMSTVWLPIHRIYCFTVLLNLWTTGLLYRSMATVQHVSISKCSYLSKSHALPLCATVAKLYRLDIGQDLPQREDHTSYCGVWSISWLSIGLRFLCRKCVLCRFQRGQANPRNRTLPWYSKEFCICYQCCLGKWNSVGWL